MAIARILSALLRLSAMICLFPCFGAVADDWAPKSLRLKTPWSDKVEPKNPLPEYPRPQLVRADWQNLNGLWQYALTPADAAKPAAFDGQILVPYPLESALSGVAGTLQPDQRLWYRREFEVSKDWKSRRVLLHFGAVDWDAEAWVDGTRLGDHRGGYDPFAFDITDALKPDAASHELVVAVRDPSDSGGQPRGKQVLKPESIWYTPTSGIWQTVWLEPVPETSIESITITTLIDGTVHVTARVRGVATAATLRAEARSGDNVVAAAEDRADRELTLRIKSPRLWQPSNPYLYDLHLKLRRNGKTIDHAESYFGLREARVGPDVNGVTRLLLNGEPLFQFGPLDQGFWPDGLYTAPTDDALRFDVEAVHKMGGNMLRKHVKVEPDRFYHWCDRLGMLVWQDMPSGNNTAESRAGFEDELRRMVDARRNHPSIIMWVPFNEGWGQYDTERVVEMLHKHDPTRLINNASGWTDMRVGDVSDVHVYPGPGMSRPEKDRAVVLGEFGGLGLPVEGHTWVDKNNWGYVSFKSQNELTNAYVGLMERLRPLVIQGLSAAVYTQTTDVEIEVNGWMTYDRQVWKIDPERAAKATAKLYEPAPRVVVVAPNAQQSEVAWKYTLNEPPSGWEKPGFDDASWQTGKGGFGVANTPGAIVGTEWKGKDIWLRREFSVDSLDFADLRLNIHHDEDAQIYLNGELLATFEGWTTAYEWFSIPQEKRALFRKGANTLAVHCRQTTGGQFIDVGMIELQAQVSQP